ncbi:hypothetical protein [Acinetobacter junii]|uniref:hypothetical protein n=1 Tax=Acinetobacter junii TaxID=40215 RepID=UPI001F15B6AC|nr:hypothetical protein [Acinetobacter junii]
MTKNARESSMDVNEFDLWLEFELYENQSDRDSNVDFANVHVILPDGRKYALNVWTFDFFSHARYPWPYEIGEGVASEYLLPPDLFVSRLDRQTLKHVIGLMLARNELKDEWLIPDDSE